MNISARLTACALVLCAAQAASAQAPTKQFATDVDAFVQRLMNETGVPSLAIAVVKGDEPVLVKGYGFADIERKIPTSENTAFYIGSMTKAFTALTISLMAERGLVDLDAPISRYLKDVKWGPGVNPDSITLRRLLSHTHGLKQDGSPIVWRTAYSGVHTDVLLKELLQYQTVTGEGRAYHYTNLGYNIAGLIVDEVTRGKWQDAITKYVTGPLKMTHTTSYISRLDSAQLAMPYAIEPNGPERRYYSKKDGNMHAAGGQVTTAADMARWLEMQINQGRLDGKQVLPQRVVAMTQTQAASANEPRGDMQMFGYGLGWMLATLNGDTVLTHGGGFATFQAQMAFMPKQRVGVAVLTSEHRVGGGMAELIAQYVLSYAQDPDAARQKFADRVTRVPEIVQGIKTRVASDHARRAGRPQTLSKPLDGYAGHYDDPQFGEMKWTVRDGKLWVEMGVLQSVAEVFDATRDQLRAEPAATGEVFTFKFADGRAVSVSYNGREFVRK